MDQMIRMCGWCHRMMEGEQAVGAPIPKPQQSQLAAQTGKKITHGICKDCYAEMMKEVEPPPSGGQGGFGAYVANRGGV